MANIDAAFGLKPLKMLGAGTNSNGVMNFKIQITGTTGTTSVIGEGTPVIPLANGLIDIVGAAAGGTVPLLGAFIGCEYTGLDGTPVFANKWPGTAAVKSGTEASALVAAHPDQLFAINCNAAMTQAGVHANANFATATTVDASTGKSGAELNVSTLATTAALNMRVVGLQDLPSSSDTSAAGMIAIVQLNNHFYRYNANGSGQGI